MIPVTIGRGGGVSTLAEGTVRWRDPSAREYGSVEFRLRRADPAWSTEHLSDVRPFAVTVPTPVGVWAGVARMESSDRAGGTFRGEHLAALVGRRHCPLSETHRGLTAGALARLAVSAALTGSTGAVRPGRFAEAAPAIDAYTFDPGDLDRILNDLAERSGQDWTVDETGRLDFGPPKGRTLTAHLAEGADLEDVSVEADPDRGSFVAATVARGGIAVPAPVVVTTRYGWGRKWGYRWGGRSDTAGTVASVPALDVREGDWVALHIPWRRSIPGGVTVARVAGRDWDGGDRVAIRFREYNATVPTAGPDLFAGALDDAERRLLALEYAPYTPVAVPEPPVRTVIRPLIVGAPTTYTPKPGTAAEATTPSGGAGTTTTPTTWPLDYREPTDVTGGRE